MILCVVDCAIRVAVSMSMGTVIESIVRSEASLKEMILNVVILTIFLFMGVYTKTWFYHYTLFTAS